MFTSLNGHHFSEYLLVLEPHEALQQQILQLKKHFAESYDCPTAVYSKPHITLLSCLQYTMAETRWIPRLERIIAAADPFMVELSDFGSFPTHTIFIQVKTKNTIIELVKSLRPLQPMIKTDKEHKPHFIMDPHMTIARKLLPWQYEKGWLEYSNTQFTGKFMANHVLLMRKQMDAKKYEVIQRFKLLGHKQTIEQSSLFDW
jgi:2'-5' RNA ligase